MALLEVRNLHVYYGKIHALRGVSLALGENQIVTLIGANGAGKSTTLRAISGILAAAEGAVAGGASHRQQADRVGKLANRRLPQQRQGLHHADRGDGAGDVPGAEAAV